MNGPARPVILSLALLVLASGCATLRPSQSPTASTPPSTASAPTTPAPRTVAVPGPVSATDPARARLDEGRALIARGEVAAAAVALREALRLRPDLAEARASLGLALYAMGDLDGAADELRGLLRVRADFAEARLTLAAVVAARQGWPAARAEPRTGEHTSRNPAQPQLGYPLLL